LSLELHDQLKQLGEKYSEELIQEGVQSIGFVYWNGFVLTLRDKKSSKYRSKQKRQTNEAIRQP
jgi:hypothetical protein